MTSFPDQASYYMASDGITHLVVSSELLSFSEMMFLPPAGELCTPLRTAQNWLCRCVYWSNVHVCVCVCVCVCVYVCVCVQYMQPVFLYYSSGQKHLLWLILRSHAVMYQLWFIPLQHGIRLQSSDTHWAWAALDLP